MENDMYERRGDEIYPSAFNDVDDYGVPVFEIRGDEAYPSIFNNRHCYGLPAFELKDGEWLPTIYNDVDDYGIPAFGDTDPESSRDTPTSDTEALGIAAFLAIGAAFVACNALKRRREQRKRELRRTEPPYSPTVTPNNPTYAEPGWYAVPDGIQYWDGQSWTEHHLADGTSTYPVATHSPYPYAPYVVASQWDIPPRRPGVVATAWIATLFTGGYMLPWAVAATRGRTDTRQIGCITAFLGWTIVGWFVALAKSLRQ